MAHEHMEKQWRVYLSGEIHSDWRERIVEGAQQARLPVTFSAPVTDHQASDDCGARILGPEDESFWKDHKAAKINAVRTRTLIADADVVVVRFGEQVSVLYGRCLHRGALMADGFVDENDNLICGVHHWDYRIDTGVSEYNNEERLHKFSSWIEDGNVLVDADEIAGWERANPQPYDREAYQGLYAVAAPAVRLAAADRPSSAARFAAHPSPRPGRARRSFPARAPPAPGSA